MSAKKMPRNALKELSDPDPSKRRAAAVSLSRGDERAIFPLLHALRDESPGVHDAAMRSLAAIGGEVTAYMVLPLLREEALLRNTAMIILREIGEPIVPLLRPLLKDRDDDVRKFALDLVCDVGRCGWPDAVALLLSDDPNPNVRAAAAKAIGVLGYREALPGLVAALGDNEWVRFSALEALAAMKDEESVDAIVRLLDHPSPATRHAAIETLGAVGSRRAGEALRVHLETARDGEKAATVKSLLRAGVPLGGEGIGPVLLGMFRDGDWDERILALRGLLELSEEGAIPVIIDVAGSLDKADPEDEEVLLEVKGMLRRFGPSEAYLRALGDPAMRYRGKAIAAEIAGELRIRACVPELIDLLKTDLRDVRRASARALGKIADEDSVNALSGAIDDRDSHVRKIAAAALGKIGDKASFGPLLRMLGEEKYDDVLEEMVGALLRIDRGALLARLDGQGGRVRELALRDRPE